MNSDAVPPDPRKTTAIHDHELLRPIASGSYGEVWLARSAVGTLRAVKIVRRDRFERAEDFEREFKGLQNFEPISRTHEGLVDILQIGRNDAEGWFYYVMELADDVGSGDLTLGSRESPAPDARRQIPDPCGYAPRTLRFDLKSRGALPADEVITLGLRLTAALAHLHGQDLVHRDVKPSNILFIGGEPKLADAGLVAAIDDARSLVGTVGYIAPEGPGTPQADLYALGKVLYEAAFGKDRQDFPQLPSDLASRPNHAILLELNEIIAKACASDPRERYANAAAMLTELESLRGGQSVKRRRTWQRTWNLAKKAALGIASLAIVLLFVYSLAQWKAAPHELKPLSKIPGAYEAYHNGMVAMHQSDDAAAARAITNFQRAIDLDPRFTAAYVRLANALFFSGGTDAQMIKARAVVEEALKLDPDLSEVHAVLASINVRADLDWAAGEIERKRSIELNSNSVDTRYESALNLVTTGRPNEAIQELERALEIESGTVSVIRLRHAGHIYAWSGRYDEAIKQYNQVVTNVSSSRPRMEGFIARACLYKGDYKSAIQHGRNTAPLPNETREQMQARYDALEKAFNEGGPDGYWRQRLVFALSRKDEGHLMELAAIYARLKQPDEAFPLLNQAYQTTHTDFVLSINTDPSFNSLHSDARWTELMNRLWHKK